MALVYEPVPIPAAGGRPCGPSGGRHAALIAEFLGGPGPSARVESDEPAQRLYQSLTYTVGCMGLRSQVGVAKRGDVVYLTRRAEGDPS